MDISSFEIQDKRLFQNFVLNIQEYTVLSIIVMWNPLHSSTLILINAFLNIDAIRNTLMTDSLQFLPQYPISSTLTMGTFSKNKMF